MTGLARTIARDRHMLAIGVVYDPRNEQWGNYVPSLVARRYDAFLFVDETDAVAALHLPVRVDGEVPETYPSAM